MKTMREQLSHIAFLVPSVTKAATLAGSFDFSVGPAEAWEGEGTLDLCRRC